MDWGNRLAGIEPANAVLMERIAREEGSTGSVSGLKVVSDSLRGGGRMAILHSLVVFRLQASGQGISWFGWSLEGLQMTDPQMVYVRMPPIAREWGLHIPHIPHIPGQQYRPLLFTSTRWQKLAGLSAFIRSFVCGPGGRYSTPSRGIHPYIHL